MAEMGRRTSRTTDATEATRATGARTAARRARYRLIREELAALLEGEPDPVARMASAAAVLIEKIPGISFAGFYRVRKGDQLVIGPYQGPVACLRIRFGRGVCGTAARENRSILVPDVHAFPGHIACDARSRSELVVPVRNHRGTLKAVLDLDSRRKASFDEIDQEEVERLMTLLFP
jgi:L-methionine (R)-S-oxide reductase